VTFRSATEGAPTAARIVPPAAGSIGDPTVGGAVLTVYNSAGLTNDVVVVDLPASGWTRIGERTLEGWRWKGTDPAGPIATVLVKSDSITVKGGNAGWTYSLDEAAQGRVAVRVRLGFSDGWCADAPARTSGNPPSTAKYDRPDLFEAQPKTPAPAVCPPVPRGSSPSGAFVE
jgi:hypothetical protein